jgi:hypothetical protein
MCASLEEEMKQNQTSTCVVIKRHGGKTDKAQVPLLILFANEGRFLKYINIYIYTYIYV